MIHIIISNRLKLKMQALKLLILFALAATVWAKYGSITIHNGGGYVAVFSVSYTLNDERKTKESPNYTLGVSKTIEIPDGATDIYVKSEAFAFIGKRSTIFTKQYDEPVQKCFRIWGTTLGTSSEEEKCPTN